MQNNFDIINSFKFNHPCATLLAGPSQSGKTTLIKKIIIENNLIEPCPSRIIYCYAIWQTAYDELIESCSSFNKKID
jgi:ABC-type proline/glycine betaine transport system ATPase subunit